MEIEVLQAEAVSEPVARHLAVLLGRAFTDQRHTSRYSDEERATLGAAVERVHAAHPALAELMPQAYLDKFPTLRNLARPASARRACEHFVALGDGYAAAHVALFAQHFRFKDIDAHAGYIEDVATDPLHLGNGLATRAMHLAEISARARGLDVLGLATGIQAFYARLGWAAWRGGHTFQVADFGLNYPDEPLMLLPLTPRGRELAAQAGQMFSWRL